MDIEKKKKYLEYYKTVFTKRITDNITLDVDKNGEFYQDYYWLLENIIVFHKLAMKICEPMVNLQLGWYFKYYFDFLREIIEKKNSFLIINIPPGHGKCFAEGTKILMHDGTKKNIEDIKKGELVMGDDSSPRIVLGTTSGYEEMFKITCEDGTSFTCNGSHILVLEDLLGHETLISVFDYLKTSNEFKYNNKIKKTKVIYEEKDVNIAPYLIGRHINDKIKYYSNILKDFIINGEKNRQLLLAGLIDNIKISCVSDYELQLINKNENLIDTIADLARSLGYFVKREEEDILEHKYYRLIIKGNIGLIPSILLKEKNISDKEPDKNVLLQDFIVESLGSGKYYGFELDKNHKFVLGDYTISHNSTSLISFICLYLGFFPHTRFFITSGTTDVRNKYRENLHKIISSDFYKELFPQVEIDPDKPDNKFGFSLKQFDYGEQTEGGGTINIKPLMANMTGLDADFIIFDDPIDYKRYKVEREQYLQTINSGVGSSIMRERGLLNNPTPFILCMQRICENDSTGFLMGTKSYEKWKHIKIPIRAENFEDTYYDKKNFKDITGKYFISPYRKWFVKNGDYIFPEKFNDEKFELNRDLINNDIDYEWQVFQDCKSESSKIFHLSCINRYTQEQIKNIEFQARVISIDSSEGDNDYQSMQLLGFVTYHNNVTKRNELNSYLLEASLSQEKTPVFINKIMDWFLEYNPDYVLVEEKSSGYEIINALEILIYGGLLDKKDPRKNKKVIGISPRLSKKDRAISASTEINSSRVFFPEEYNKIARLDKKQVFVLKEIEREMDVFPSGNNKVHDDGVDAFTQGINWARVFFNKKKERRVIISYV